MAMVVLKDCTVLNIKSEELQKMLKDEVAKSKIFSWLYIK